MNMLARFVTVVHRTLSQKPVGLCFKVLLVLLVTSPLPLLAQSADDLSRRANDKVSNKDYDGAIADFTAAIAKANSKGRMALYLYWRAGAKRDKGDLQGALADINQAIDVETSTSSMTNDLEFRADLLEKMGDLPGALADLTRNIAVTAKIYTDARRFPNNAREYASRGEFKARHGDPNGAIEDLEAAVSNAEQQPKDGLYYYESTQRYRETLAKIREDNSPEKYIRQATSLSESGKYADAIAILNEADKRFPKNAGILVTRAFQYLFLNQPDKAKLDLDAAQNAKR